MSISPSDFLASAKQLMVDQSEPSTRNAVSRAYYAAFHQALGVFRQDAEFAKNSKTGMHQTYIDQLMRADTGSLERTIAVKLSSLKGKRVKADYRLNETFPSYVAALQVKAAEDVFDLLNDQRPVEISVEEHSSSAADIPTPPPQRPRLTRIR